MKEEILSISSDLREDKITPSEAKKELLILFSENKSEREEMDEKWETLRNSGMDNKLKKW
jgi:hypothetical protein